MDKFVAFYFWYARWFCYCNFLICLRFLIIYPPLLFWDWYFRSPNISIILPCFHLFFPKVIDVFLVSYGRDFIWESYYFLYLCYFSMISWVLFDILNRSCSSLVLMGIVVRALLPKNLCDGDPLMPSLGVLRQLSSAN